MPSLIGMQEGPLSFPFASHIGWDGVQRKDSHVKLSVTQSDFATYS